MNECGTLSKKWDSAGPLAGTYDESEIWGWISVLPHWDDGALSFPSGACSDRSDLFHQEPLWVKLLRILGLRTCHPGDSWRRPWEAAEKKWWSTWSFRHLVAGKGNALNLSRQEWWSTSKALKSRCWFPIDLRKCHQSSIIFNWCATQASRIKMDQSWSRPKSYTMKPSISGCFTLESQESIACISPLSALATTCAWQLQVG